MTKGLLTNELDGFTVYKPTLRAVPGIFLSINKTSIRFSVDAIRAMNTEWLLLFFDRNKQRLMIQPAKKGTVNALKLNSQGGKGCNSLIQKSVLQDVRDLAEVSENKQYICYGHKCNYAVTPSIIFNLKEAQEKG